MASELITATPRIVGTGPAGTTPAQVHVLVLNYNGGELLLDSLPAAMRAARSSQLPARVSLVDNGSTDGSIAMARRLDGGVEVFCCANRGLCSFNEVAASLSEPVIVLLNNDVVLDDGALDPLVAPLLDDRDAEGRRVWMTAARCWRADGGGYDGQRTAVWWHWGLVRASWQFNGYECGAGRGGETASAGAAIAVNRRRFLALGGFDPLYLPGRIEDLDLAFRAYQTGYRARYVPEAVARHVGGATFDAALGAERSAALALRNTLLFQWKNLRHPRHVVRQTVALPVRLGADVVQAAWQPRGRRWRFTRALAAAAVRWVGHRVASDRPRSDTRREREFFARYHPRAMARTVETVGDG